jgi:hypothetical protein
MSYKDYLGRSFGGSFITPNEAIDGIRQCPVGQVITYCLQLNKKASLFPLSHIFCILGVGQLDSAQRTIVPLQSIIK